MSSGRITAGEFFRKKLENYKYSREASGYGIVKSSSDGIVSVEGLSSCRFTELLRFENDEYGLALELYENGVSAVLLSEGSTINTGSVVFGTGRVADIGVGESLLGRIVDPIGRPLDEMPLTAEEYRAVEMPAPSITERAPVNQQLETGILAIDSMISIGRGQSELIIGDSQTGKTSVALSAIMNQAGKNVVCIYCAAGQKASNVAASVKMLKESGAMEYTAVVASTAGDSAALQYLAPFSACSIAEYFMYKGRDVLIVYDDLSKHAAAYREMSLLLRRPFGREAYPGDVFWLHSRLLERAAKLSDKYSGGSMTALPIAETTAGNISAYIPSNVISITDGQIYLDRELFNAGIRPAINVGLSVSRTGRAAQHEAIKKVSGNLRTEAAYYRDMAVLAQFAADDSDAAASLKRGEQLMSLLQQSQRITMSLSEQVCILIAFGSHIFGGTSVSDLPYVRDCLLEKLKNDICDVMAEIDETGMLSEQNMQTVRQAAAAAVSEINQNN